MIRLQDVSYVRLGTADLEGATAFATEYLGLEIAYQSKDSVYLKSDQREHTLQIEHGVLARNRRRERRARFGECGFSEIGFTQHRIRADETQPAFSIAAILLQTGGELLNHAAEMRAILATPERRSDELRGRIVATLFYEASTRTRLSFEIAARALGAEIISFDVGSSSVGKGESLVDTLRTLRALGADVVVVRHERSGAPWLAARTFDGSVINAGDGWHAHPTQALLDLSVLSAHLGGGDGSLRGRSIAIVGDLLQDG